MGVEAERGEYSVLHLGKFYPPHSGGMETHLRDLAVRQADRAQVSVVVANAASQHERAVIERVNVTRVGRLTTIASMPVCPGLTAAIRDSPADLVHLHAPNPGAAFALERSGHRGQLVITHHADTLGRKALRKISDVFVRKAMDRAAAIIVTSKRYLDTSPELVGYQEKCRVIPLGIDLSTVDGAPPSEIPPDLRARPLLLAVGRMVPYKGFDLLIRAMERVSGDLVLIGEGPEAKDLRALAEGLGLRGRVHMMGRVEDLRAYYRAASVFVMPSVTRAEAFGLVQLEAMAAGLPVINTRIDSGVPEVSLHEETGLTVPPGDVGALAGAMRLLLERKDLREQYGRAARERVVEEFTADKMAERTLALYEEILCTR